MNPINELLLEVYITTFIMICSDIGSLSQLIQKSTPWFNSIWLHSGAWDQCEIIFCAYFTLITVLATHKCNQNVIKSFTELLSSLWRAIFKQIRTHDYKFDFQDGRYRPLCSVLYFLGKKYIPATKLQMWLCLYSQCNDYDPMQCIFA